jgi:iron complex outermembrane receptor protein
MTITSSIALLAALSGPDAGGQPASPPVHATPDAQADAQADAPDDDAIIVTALPPPPAAGAYGVEQLNHQILSGTASGRIEDALARVPGFQQFRRSDSRSANVSAQGITLRAIGGNAASRTLLLLDGVPQADAFFGFIPFSALPAEGIGSATIVRGSGTGPFGAGAVAGVVALSSLSPASRPHFSAGLTLGSRDSRQIQLGTVLALGAGHIAIDLADDRGDGFETTPAAQRTPATVPSRYRGSSLSVSAAVPVGDNAQLFPRITAYRDARTLRFAGADNGATGVDASLRYVRQARWQLEALGWVQARDFSSIVVSATSFRPTLNQRATPTTGWGAKLELRPPLAGRTVARFGVDLRGSVGEAIEDALAVSGARTLTRRAGGQTLIGGGFVEGDAVFGPLALTGGARLDGWQITQGHLQEVRADGSVQTDTHFARRSGIIPSIRGAASWQLPHGFALRASAYTGFRLPTLNELYRGFTVFPVVTRANADLSPERLRGWEGAVEFSPSPAVHLGVTLFDNRLSNAIANVTIAPNIRQRRNVAAIRARGVEGTVRLAWRNWSLNGGWAFAHSRLVIAADDLAAAALAGLVPAQSPRHSGSLQLAWQIPAGPAISAGLRHIGAQFEDDRNVDRLPSATLADAVIRQPLGRGWAVQLRGENLFDVAVQTRNVGGSIDYGAPRTLWVGLRWAAD